jgi:formiminoglutamate deiminase
LNGSGLWHAEQAWLGRPARDVLIEVEAGRIKTVTESVAAPASAVPLRGWTIPGFANVHSHAFQRQLRGTTESPAGDFWTWRKQMYRSLEGLHADYEILARHVFREMVLAGFTAVGEFHYLHRYRNSLGEALIKAARHVGIRLTLLDACYLQGGMGGRPLKGVIQESFSDGTAERWAERVDELEDADGLRIGAAIHSVRAVDPQSMQTVAAWARRHGAPLHIHLAEQPAEVEECLEVEGCTPTEFLERNGILGPDLTAVHAIHLDDHDIGLLGKHRVAICSCPTTERDLGDRVGPLRELASAGSPLCIGSDANAVIDPFEEARGVELDQRRATGRRGLHTPEELLEAATVAGMRSIGWEAGELKAGMLGDFVTVRPPGQHAAALDAAYMVFCCSARDVTNVVVGGKTIVSQ